MAEAFLAGAARHSDTRSAGVALVRSDPRHDLDRVGCPCLCLWGAADNWVPLADGMEYARRLQAPLRVIADCGHLLIGERPDVVLAAVRGFLASLDGPVGLRGPPPRGRTDTSELGGRGWHVEHMELVEHSAVADRPVLEHRPWARLRPTARLGGSGTSSKLPTSDDAVAVGADARTRGMGHRRAGGRRRLARRCPLPTGAQRAARA